MPARLRLDVERSLEISLARLSPRYGCGLMLRNLEGFDESDALLNVMNNYGYARLSADRPARRIVANPALLKPFYDNAFAEKLPIRRNFYQVYGEQDVFVALDAKAKQCWFVSEPPNRMALVNYFRDAVSLGLKALGAMLVGSTPRLTPVGWQNLHDLLSDEFFILHPSVKRVEVMSAIAGARWREPSLGLGVSMLNLKEPAAVRQAAKGALAGEDREDG